MNPRSKRKFKNGTRVLSPKCHRGTVEAGFRDAETCEWFYVVKMDEMFGADVYEGPAHRAVFGEAFLAWSCN
jgi:hypothetical protein